ncbi:hypothetical protein ABZP36_000915 [Zizania latifolia]
MPVWQPRDAHTLLCFHGVHSQIPHSQILYTHQLSGSLYKNESSNKKIKASSSMGGIGVQGTNVPTAIPPDSPAATVQGSASLSCHILFL